MNVLPNWPLLVALAYAAGALAVMWTWSRRLDRAERDAHRRDPSPAE